LITPSLAASSNRPSFEDVMYGRNAPCSRDDFRNFLRNQMAEEGFDFLLDNHYYKQGPTLEGAERIVKLYLTNDSPHQVNVSADALRRITQKVANMRVTKKLESLVFDEAEAEVTLILKSSELFGEFLRKSIGILPTNDILPTNETPSPRSVRFCCDHLCCC
jgi:hypothetical protein